MNTHFKKIVVPLAIIATLFFVIGFGIGISGFLTPALKDAFNLSNKQSYLIIASIFSAFVIFGKSAGRLITRIGYRKGILVALSIMSVGMLLYIPSAISISFSFFLIASFIGGIGNTILQAAVNPYVTIIGSEHSAAKRMSIMGIMNKLAWWIAPVFLGLFINLNKVHLEDVTLPFVIVSLLLFALGLFVYFSPLPEIEAPGESDVNDVAISNENYGLSIWSFPNLYLGVVALFLYVGIETLPMVSIIDFSKVTFGNVSNPERYSKFVTFGMTLGYIFGVLAIPKFISQTNALRLFAILGVLSSLLLIHITPYLAFYCILLISFANSIMWPAIWPLAISGLGKFTKKGSSFLVMSIVGGAVIPLMFGYLVDVIGKYMNMTILESYQKAYWLLVPCYLYILYYAVSGYKIRFNR